MKKFLSLLLLLMPVVALAQEEPYELLIEFKTSLYDEDGADNALSIALGGVTEGVYVDIDCGFGKEEFEVGVATLDSTSVINGTTYEGKVSKAGIVRIYGNPAEIDYLNASGNSISEITFHPDLNMHLLNLEHNNIGKLNLNELDELQVLYIMDNPFDVEPFNITAQLGNLAILEIGELGNIAPDFSITRFPMLMSIDAYYTRGLKSIDPSQCPLLYRLSLEMTDVETLDLSQNQNLMVLNVSDTRISTLDLSNNAELLELYCTQGSGTINTDVKLSTLDLTPLPKLEYLFCGGNNFTTLDVSQNPNLMIFSAPKNQLTSVNFENNPNLYTVNLSGNKLNFATLPAPQETWGEYYYDEADLELADNYKVGDVLDFSAQVLRAGTETNAVLVYVPKDDPTNYQTLDEGYYTYADGKVTLLQPHSCQYRLVFYNSLLNEYPLYTEPFRVKSEEDFGKDEKQISISSITGEGATVNLAIGIVGASAENPVTIHVDYGDDEELKAIVVTDEVPTTFNAKSTRTGYGNINVYVPQDHYISALKTKNLAIGSIDLSELSELRVLSIVNADLYKLDLSYNAKLEELTVTGNANLKSLSLKGQTPYYYKGRMQKVDLSNNALEELTYDDLYMMHFVNLSKNKFTEFDVTDADYMEEINISDNQIEFLQFNNSNNLKKVEVANNNLYYIYIPEEAPMNYLDLSGNTFAYGYMPENLWNLDDAHYIYAPQQAIQLPLSSPGIDLSAYYLSGLTMGSYTTFVWKKADGTTLTRGTDYTITKGDTKFLAPIIGEQVYCELSHPDYPQFTGENVLRTSLVKVIDMPQIVLASFTTTADNEVATVALKGNKNNISIYIDWLGNGNVTQYALDANEVLYAEAYTKKGANVRVLAAEAGDNCSVFSIADASMSSFDGSGLTDAVLIGVEGAGLNSITLPASAKLTELKLSGNKFTSFDLTPYPNLVYFGFNNNLLTSFDFGTAPKLQLAFLAYNKLTEVTFNNQYLWNLDLGCNQFTQISFTGAPNIDQLWLNGNKFENIDVSYLTRLRVLDVVDNKLTFETLAHFLDENFSVFRYGNQADIAATAVGNVVDLGVQACVGDSLTTYRWFIGKPEYDENGELQGEELYVDEEYTVFDGITTFTTTAKIEDLVCVMTNSALPNLTLYTLPLTINGGTSIEQVTTATSESTSKELRNGVITIRSNGRCYNAYGQRMK